MFDLPSSTNAVRSAGRNLVRIVDPAGLAIAWFDPDSASCAGFMVRSLDPGQRAWLPVFAAPDDRDPGTRSHGCAVLATVGDPGPWVEGQGSREAPLRSRWELLERDPTSVVLESALRTSGVAADLQAADVSRRLSAQLEDATLALVLTVRNDGIMALPFAFGLRPVFARGLESGSLPIVVLQGDERVHLDLPAAAGVDGAAARGRADLSPTDHRAASAKSAQVVVTCEEGVQYVGSQTARPAGPLVLTMLASTPGEPAVLPPGANACLAITVAVGAVRERCPQ